MAGIVTEGAGFERAAGRDALPTRYVASLELMTGLALVVSTVIAATVVSIGIARAGTLTAEVVADRSFAVATVLGLVLAGWACVTILIMRVTPRRD